MPTFNDYSDLRMDGKDKSSERSQGNQGTAGEFGQGNGPLYVPTENYPYVFNYGYDPSGNRMFSNDKADTPDAMQAEASGGAFAELQDFLMNSPYTPGSRVCHDTTEGPWTPPHPEKKQPGDGKTGPA